MTVHVQTVTNPGAETGNTTGWTHRSGNNFTSATTDTGLGNGPHGGSRLFSVSNGFGGVSSWDQDIAVDASLNTAIDAGIAAVKFSGWHEHLAESGHIYVQFFDGGMSLLGSAETSDTAPTSWTQDILYARIPASTRTVRFGSYNTTPGFGSNTFWDDYALEISDHGEADYPDGLAPKAHQLVAYALATFPSEQIRTLQVPPYALAASQTSSGLFQAKTHQLSLYAWAAPRPRRRRMQAWTFSLDGHDFYVLNLADEWTLVLDIVTGQWSEWRSPDQVVWRARIGQNWLGIGPDTVDRLFGTNVVVGDDTQGLLWILDPAQGYDDAVDAEDDGTPFVRYVTGLVPMRMRETQSCAAVYLNLSLGAPTVSGASIQLRTSDDGGSSFYDHGSVTITPSDFTQEVAWRGLGLIRAQGRIFELTDTGAAVRINSAEMA